MLLSTVASPKMVILDPPMTYVQQPTVSAGVVKPRRKLKPEQSKKTCRERTREREVVRKMTLRPHVKRDTHPKKVPIQSKM
ncbi:hypothetical protein PSACC_03560 [Paramicrosporidium saccamoebae]|uniref:Uncharacterized protein n=1 Tax=Paramicrosporidium saccamoebae TaxID=1246581 RepID=A0A2H9TFP0_9FUNG|nr:hypothetical protein PSACC_03560 [Paramicrosporidium saccamoebae]